MKDFLQLARRGGLLFDGAMGSLLYERGVFLTNCFEAVNLSQPELVRQIHQEYLQAGARVLTTNTFGANAYRLARHGLADKADEINRAGVRLAIEVAGGGAFVAGSVGPTGLGLEALAGEEGPRAEAALRAHLEVLLDAGVDVVCLETFYVLAELEMAVRLAWWDRPSGADSSWYFAASPVIAAVSSSVKAARSAADAKRTSVSMARVARGRPAPSARWTRPPTSRTRRAARAIR